LWSVQASNDGWQDVGSLGMKKHGCAVYGTMKQERIGRDAVRPKGEGMDARIKTVW